MAYTNIDDPSAHFQTKLYTGTGNSLALTNDGNSDLKPDFVWIKRRDGAYSHALFDSSRGSTERLVSNLTQRDDTNAQYITSFNTDGFTTGTDANINGNNLSYVAWQWKANGGTTSTNTDGTITSTVQANTDAGFSIFTYTGTGAELPSIGHGLDAAADIYFQKNRSSSASWAVLGKTVSAPSGGGNRYLLLNETNAEGGASQGPGNATTIQTWSDATGNASGDEYVVYAFTSKQGFSKINYYTGNGNANGPFVYTGFKPAFLLVKKSSGTGNWILYDNKGESGNLIGDLVYPNLANAEESNTNGYDFLSNGFKARNTYGDSNASGSTYIYMAFAENPLVTSTGVPTTAR